MLLGARFWIKNFGLLGRCVISLVSRQELYVFMNQKNFSHQPARVIKDYSQKNVGVD